MALVVAPAMLNDLFYLRDLRPGEWLAVDYGSRLAAIAIMVLVGFRWRDILTEGSQGDRSRIGAIPVGLIAVLFINGPLDRWLVSVLPDFSTPGYPTIDDAWLKSFDLTVGISLVAISEELIFRAYAYATLARLGLGDKAIVIVSALLFGAIHWSNGPASVVGAALVGVVFMIVYRRARSLWPSIIIHYVVDVIEFS